MTAYRGTPQLLVRRAVARRGDRFGEMVTRSPYEALQLAIRRSDAECPHIAVGFVLGLDT